MIQKVYQSVLKYTFYTFLFLGYVYTYPKNHD